MNKCLNCDTETSNPKFCGRSCAAKHNNVKFPKKKLNRTCIECDNPVTNYRKIRCDHHLELYKSNKHKLMTIGEYRSRESVKGKHPSWIHSHVRQFARHWLKELTQSPCKHCGYSKHVELCHIKGLATFEDSALLSEINSAENVIQLCRNCHWEFDNLPRE